VVLVLQIFISNKMELLHTCQEKFLDDYRKHSVIIWFRSKWTVATISPRLKSTGHFWWRFLNDKVYIHKGHTPWRILD
jgi:hypothetical protein